MAEDTETGEIVFTNNPNAPTVYVDGIKGVFANKLGIITVELFQHVTKNVGTDRNFHPLHQKPTAANLIIHIENLKTVVSILTEAIKEAEEVAK